MEVRAWVENDLDEAIFSGLLHGVMAKLSRVECLGCAGW